MMQVIGFNFTQISAKKPESLGKVSLSTNIEFTNVEKENIELLKDTQSLKISFNYSLDYTDDSEKKDKKPQITISGNVVFTATEEEEKELLKSWKDKKVPTGTKIPLFNLILRKCSPKAVYLADELGLPSPTPFPKIAPKPQEE